jgi:serine protease Do
MEALADLGARLRRVTAEVRGGRGVGSGVVWSPDGLIVTAAHVVGPDPTAHAGRTGALVVALEDGHTLRAALVGWDRDADLAALRVDAHDLNARVPGDAATLRVGEIVVAVGSPFGYAGSLAVGVVHAVPGRRDAGRPPCIVADLRLAPGNSGGPLADAAGRVVGINAMIRGGLALAVPGGVVDRFLRGR